MKIRFVVLAVVAALLLSNDVNAKRPDPTSDGGGNPNRGTVSPSPSGKRPERVVPGRSTNSTPRPPKPKPKSSTLTDKLADYTTALDLALAVEYEDNLYILPYSFWRSLTATEREKLNTIGLTVLGEDYFIAVCLEDDSAEPVDWASASESGYLPDKEAGELIATRAAEINEALKQFGGTALSPFYWTSTPKDDDTAWQIDVDGGFVYGYKKTLKSSTRTVYKSK